jgi:hypothetical protein
MTLLTFRLSGTAAFDLPFDKKTGTSQLTFIAAGMGTYCLILP